MLETIFASLFLLIVGVLVLFLGYMFFRILLPIWGFIVGFIMAAEATALFLGTGFLGTLTGWVMGFLFGVLLAALSWAIYSIGIGLLGASVGAWLTAVLLYSLGLNTEGFMFTLFVLVMAVIFGVGTVMLKAQKYLIIMLTSFGGASALILSVLILFGQITVTGVQLGDPLRQALEDSLFWLTVWIMLTSLGVFVQAASTKAVELDTENYALPGMDASNSGDMS